VHGGLVRDDAGVEGANGDSVDAEPRRSADEHEDGDGKEGAGDIAADCCQSARVFSSSDAEVGESTTCSALVAAAEVTSGHGCVWRSMNWDPGTRNAGQPGRDALRCLIHVDGAVGGGRMVVGGLAGSSAQSGMPVSTRDSTSSSAAVGLAESGAANISTL